MTVAVVGKKNEFQVKMISNQFDLYFLCLWSL